MKSWTTAIFTVLWASPADAQTTPPPPPPIPDYRAFDLSDLKSIEIPTPPSEAKERLRAAEGHKRAGRWELAIDEASQAIRLSPGSIEAYRFRANSYDEKRLFRRAIADFSEVVRLDPNDLLGSCFAGGPAARIGISSGVSPTSRPPYRYRPPIRTGRWPTTSWA